MKSLYNLVLLIQYVYLVVVGLRWPSNTKMEKLTMQNIRLDNERLQHETLKLKKNNSKNVGGTVLYSKQGTVLLENSV